MCSSEVVMFTRDRVMNRRIPWGPFGGSPNGYKLKDMTWIQYVKFLILTRCCRQPGVPLWLMTRPACFTVGELVSQA